MNEDILSFLGRRIKQLREEKALSQEDLSFLANLDRSYISELENGKRNVSLKTIYVLSIALNVEISEIFIDYK